MATKVWHPPSSGTYNWSTTTYWTGGALPVAGDDVCIGNQSGADGNNIRTLNLDIASTPALNSLTIDHSNFVLAVGAHTLNVNSAAGSSIALGAGTLSVAGGAINLGASGAINLADNNLAGSGAKGSKFPLLSGFGAISGAIVNNTATAGLAGEITATGGTLEIAGRVTDTSSTLILNIAGAADVLKLDGASAAHTATFGSSGTLELNTSGTLTIGTALTVNAGTVKLDGSASTLTDASGVTLSTGAITGQGKFAAAVSASGAAHITASGGKLEITGKITNTGTLALSMGTGATLLIDGAASAATSATFSGTSGTLEIASTGALTLANALSLAANDTLKLDGGALTDSAGLAIGAGANVTGFGSITGPLSGAGTVTALGGALTFASAVDAASATVFQIGSGGDLVFDGNVGTGTVAPTVTFLGGANGTLDLSADGALSGFHASISGFAGGDSIKVAGSAGGGDKVVWDQATHTLSIETSTGAVLETLTLAGATFNQADFHVAGAGGVDTITCCFVAGTMIRTPDGAVAVETLKRGDLVMTADGRAEPVTWLGRQTVSSVFADPERVWPIRVKAGALADNAPSRDLVLSPDHALLVDGALIQAGALVNGTSVARETRVARTFVYYHVELDDHSLILAENAPAETFIDNVDRLAYDNWAEHQGLYPEGKAIAEMPYPRAKSRRQVPVSVRVMLAERAMAIGAAPAAVA